MHSVHWEYTCTVCHLHPFAGEEGTGSEDVKQKQAKVGIKRPPCEWSVASVHVVGEVRYKKLLLHEVSPEVAAVSVTDAASTATYSRSCIGQGQFNHKISKSHITVLVVYRFCHLWPLLPLPHPNFSSKFWVENLTTVWKVVWIAWCLSSRNKTIQVTCPRNAKRR